MPQRDVTLLLQDAAAACGLISRAVAVGRDEYLADPIRRAAVERQIEIIGEALKRILDVEPGLSLRMPEASEVISFRNFVAHGYFLIDHAIVWKIAERDVPTLLRRVSQILSERSRG